MKKIAAGLVATILSVSSSVSAEVLDEGDDLYVGLQINIPLESDSNVAYTRQTRFSFLLIEQRDGISDGIAYSHDNAGNSSLDYVRPSTSFKIGRSSISDYALPIFRGNAEGGIDPDYQTNYSGLEFGIFLIAGTVFVIDKLEEAFKDFPGDEDPQEDN